MSHIVTIETQVTDAAAVRSACQRLGLAQPEHGTVRLPGVQFLRRFLQHVLPRGFHKVRYAGLWHHSNDRDMKGMRPMVAYLFESVIGLLDFYARNQGSRGHCCLRGFF